MVSAVPMITAAMLSAARISMASCGLVAAGVGPAQAGIAGNQQGQRRQRERQNRQEQEVEAVGEKQPDVCRRTTSQICRVIARLGGGGHGAATSGGAVGRRCLLPGAERAVGTVGIGAHLLRGPRPVGGAHRGLDLQGRSGEGHGARRR